MKCNPFVAILTSLLLLWGCSDLEENPRGFIAPENFYKTQDDALSALTAVYDPLSGYPNLFSLTEWNTDDIRADQIATADFAAYYIFSAATARIGDVWQNQYVGINAANAVIDRVPNTAMNGELRNRIIAEAKFLRALYYFNLVRLFGGVPLPIRESTSLEGLDLPRSPEAEVYTQILKDLQEAEAGLPATYAGADRGRATKWAASALMAKVFLTRASLDGVKQSDDYAKAAAKAQEVINSRQFSLWADYADAFKVANKNGKESIFEVQFKGSLGVEGNSLMTATLPRNTILGQGLNQFQATDNLVRAFEAGDRRLTAGFFSEYTLGTTRVTFAPAGPRITKYIDFTLLVPGTNTASRSFSTDNNIYVLRYADVLLMAAEALNESGGGPSSEAYQYLNQIRQRARNGNPAILGDLTGLTQSQFREAVLLERRRELFLEGHRWFDLVRTKRLVPTLKAVGATTIQEFHNRYPIPQREMDVNTALEQSNQNPGY